MSTPLPQETKMQNTGVRVQIYLYMSTPLPLETKMQNTRVRVNTCMCIYVHSPPSPINQDDTTELRFINIYVYMSTPLLALETKIKPQSYGY